MGKLKFILPLFILLGLALWAVPTLLQAMPDRYVMRLPQPLQQYGLPEDSAPILPTVASPVDAALLLAEPETVPTPTLAATPEQSSTKISAPATVTTIPTSTPQPTILPTATPWPLPQSARLSGVQHIFQDWNNCGPATLAMGLSFFNHYVTQSDSAAVLKPDPEDRNVSPQEMAAYVNNKTDLTAVTRTNGNLDILRRAIANNIPVIIEVGIEPPGEFRWLGWYGHYLLVVAYDDAQEQLWVYDSWFGTSEEPLQNSHPDGRVLTYADLETYWPHFNHNYLAIFQPDQADTFNAIIGDDSDDQKMWQNALVDVQAATAVTPDNAFNWFNLGTVYNALGDYEAAATAFDQARAIGLPWRMLWYQFGPYEAYLQTGRYDDVILLADTTLKDRPYFEESFYYKGMALAAQGETAAAQEFIEKAVSFNPNNQLTIDN